MTLMARHGAPSDLLIGLYYVEGPLDGCLNLRVVRLFWTKSDLDPETVLT